MGKRIWYSTWCGLINKLLSKLRHGRHVLYQWQKKKKYCRENFLQYAALRITLKMCKSFKYRFGVYVRAAHDGATKKHNLHPEIRKEGGCISKAGTQLAALCLQGCRFRRFSQPVNYLLGVLWLYWLTTLGKKSTCALSSVCANLPQLCPAEPARLLLLPLIAPRLSF